MDDSDQDFVDLCSKLLKRVRRKAGVTQKRSVAEPSSQDTVKNIPTKRVTNRRKKKDVGPSSKGALGNNSEHVSSTSTTCDDPNRLPSNTDKSKQAVVNGGIELGVGENGSSVAVDVAGSQPEGRGMGVKEKILWCVFSFICVYTQWHANYLSLHLCPSCSVPSTSASSPLPLDPQVDDSDEALALRLQEELDREAQAVAQGSLVDLEQGGLFFCQLCQKDLSAMSPTGRTQHINRCLDESEDSAAPAPPSVPECPICGKRFKSQMSRAAHLKRCSSTMGVAPAELLQAVQRQVAEGLTDSTANQPPFVLTPPPGKGRGKRRKGAPPRPPPLLLVQDSETALRRLQERVAGLLLRTRAPSPPTPTRCPSSLPSCRTGADPLWQKSALRDGGPKVISEFYTPELREFIQPWVSVKVRARVHVALSRLASDLTSMVNNPQFSDVQLQVDSGEVYFTHSFMLYARCPLLAQMVSARVDFELQQLCQLYPAQTDLHRGVEGQGDQWGDYPAQEHQSGGEEEHQDQVFMELLRSMWNEEEGRGDGVTIEDGETNEERVNEEEMEEIYEFAATQRKRDERKESEKEESEEEEEGGVTFFTETEEEQEAPIQAHSLAEHSDKGELTCMMSPQTKSPNLEADMATGDIDTDRGNPNRIKTDLSKSEGRDLERSRTATMESDRTKQFESNVTSSRSVGEVSTTKSLHSSPIDDQELNASLDQLTSPPPPSSCSQPTRVRVDGGTRPTVIPTLQYSAIEIIDLSISPPLVPGVSALPVPGLSPGEVTDTGARVRTKGVVGRGKVPVCKEILQEKVPSSPEDLKRESYGPYSISVPVSPPHSTKEEPELIVLSDSSEEMEIGDLGPTSPSPPPTHLSQNHQGYTRITTQSNTEPKKPTSITQSDTEPKKSSSKEKETIGGFVRDPSVSPSDQGLDPDPPGYKPGSNPGSAGSTSLMDCSAEMSWLIPATPPLPSRRTSSTQTFSSMRRTQLFPKANSSSSSSAASVFSSPTLPFRPSRQTSHPPRVSTHSAQTESSISRQKSDSRGLRHSSLGLEHDDLSSQKYNSGSGSTVPSKSQPKRSRLTPSLSVIPPPDPSTKGTPLHNIPQPYSSTPLYSDLPKPSAPSLASPLLRDGEGDNGTRQRGRGLGISGSPWKRGGEGSLGLSLSDPSDPSSSPHKESLTQPRENSGSPGQRRPSSESKYFHSPGDSETGGEKERGVREESDEIMKMEELERTQCMAVVSVYLPPISFCCHPALCPPSRFGVRALPKRQMILKLKEIHQYTHQVVSSESDDEAPSLGCPRAVGPPPTTMEPTRKPVSCAQAGGDPIRPPQHPVKTLRVKCSNIDTPLFSRPNPEQCLSDDSDNDNITASQSASKLQDKLVAVRHFIQSDPDLYGQILHYQPLVLSDLQARLKAAGIQLGAAKLLDYLDSQCITFTTIEVTFEGIQWRQRWILKGFAGNN
uniref:Structure-specific endonuclease subunit SLX4 n=1 Tax=Oncorhynchus mykiss TaxID=8022 RepID=A0A8K9XD11_ONCMY